ncbi:hypothetical protein [Rhizobium laguerreae]|uniref:hypothetical protein n=1 Tax=Rhizobium laguerreae TaxID=1076926 RepID=UPI00300BC3D7
MSDEYKNFPRVIKVIDDYNIVINRGSEHKVALNSRFLVFGAGEQLSDPDTGEDLGVLELVRGKARVTHVQAKISTLTSDEFAITPGKKRTIKRQGAMWTITNQPQIEEVVEGEERHQAELGAKTGDYARPA